MEREILRKQPKCKISHFQGEVNTTVFENETSEADVVNLPCCCIVRVTGLNERDIQFPEVLQRQDSRLTTGGGGSLLARKGQQRRKLAYGK